MNRTPVPDEFRSPDGPTQAQLDYIDALFDLKRLTASPRFFDIVNAMDAEEYTAYIAHLKAQARTVTKQRASDIIKSLLALPNNEVVPASNAPRTPPVDVMNGRTRVEWIEFTDDSGKTHKSGKIILPDGREVIAGSYGVDTSSDNRFTNDFSFFKVWVAEGYGKGWGVKMYTSDYTHRVKLAGSTQVDVVQMIADAGPLDAAKAFGHEFGRCGVCSRGLTNDESRDLGIGPVCGRRLGVR
jgi:hypothetical protein